MESQVFEPRAYSLRPVDLIPDDTFDDDDADVQWQEYCRVARTVDRTRILEVVLSDLDADDSPLYELIDSALDCPHEPGRPKESISVLAGIGKAILAMIAHAVDDLTNLKMLAQGRND